MLLSKDDILLLSKAIDSETVFCRESGLTLTEVFVKLSGDKFRLELVELNAEELRLFLRREPNSLFSNEVGAATSQEGLPNLRGKGGGMTERRA